MANNVKIAITADANQFKEGMQQAQSTANNFGKSLTSTGQKAQTFNGQLRQARKQALELADAYSKLDQTARNSDFGRSLKAQLDEALQTAGRLTDLKGDVMENIKNIASDTQMWDGAKQGISIVSDSMQGLVSLYGLAGGETKKFAQALVAVNAVESAANTIIGIGNALQRQSALMTALRAAKNALFTTSKTAATAAEVAETTAMTANTAATTANTGATVAATTATVAQTAATDAATTSQLALNVAVLANPYVLAAAAIAALCAGIYLWVDSMDEAKEEQEGLTEAVSAANDAQKAGYETYIRTRDEMDRLINTVNNFKGTKQEEKKLVEDLNSKYGDSLGRYKDLNAWKSALTTTTLYYCRALEAEAKYQALAKVAYEAYANAMAGEDYDKNMAKYKRLKQYMQDAQDDQSFYNDMLRIARSNAGSIASTQTKVTKATKSTHDEVKRTLNTLEGCEAIISDAEKEMKKLDRTTSDYTSKVETLRKKILTAKQAKFNLIDKSSIDGLNEARKLAQDIITELPSGSADFKKWNDELLKVDTQLFNIYDTLSQNGDIEMMKQAKTQIGEIITRLPKGSAELDKWVNKFREIDEIVKRTDQNTSNLLNGVQEGSATWIDQQISMIESELKNLSPDIEGNMMVIWNKQQQIEDLKKLKGTLEELTSGLGVEVPAMIDITFDYKKTPLEKIERDIEHYQKIVDDLRKKEGHVSPETWQETQKQIRLTEDAIKQLKKSATLAEMSEDIKEYTRNVREGGYETFQSFTDGLHSLYDAFANLPERLDNCKDGFEAFFEVLNTGFGIIDSIVSFIDNLNKLTQVTELLTGAKEAHAAVLAKETGAIMTNTAVTEVASGVSATNAAAKSIEAQQSFTAAGANAAEAASSAAAQNSSLGPWGWIAGIAAAVAIAATLFALIGQAKGFATGGIVGGNSNSGDKIIARVNSGEMILNKRQQSNLFNLLDNGINTTNNVPTDNIITTFRIKGDDLYVVLKNHKKITGKTL